jgi:MoaA/NifB/PqqE/SkfB family radical SAM enzyme
MVWPQEQGPDRDRRRVREGPVASAARALHDVATVVPPHRLVQFTRSWVLNALVIGPRRRRRLEARLGVHLPGTLNVSPSQECNLTCRGCYAAGYRRGVRLGPEALERLLGEARSIGVRVIGILGGEPLLRRDLLPVLAQHREMAFRISTNGTLVDDEIIRFLSDCGHVVLFLSVEGLEAETDAWRGPGTFARVRESMCALRRARILFGFSALVHRHNLKLVISHRFLREMEQLGARLGIYFPYGPVGRNPDPDLVVEEEELHQAFEMLTERQASHRLFLLKEGFVRRGRPFGEQFNEGCNAGRSLHLTPEGYVEPCNAIQFHTHSIPESSLLEAVSAPFYRAIHESVRRDHGRCLAIREPQAILDLVNRHGARGSNGDSRRSLEAWARRPGAGATGRAKEVPAW